MTRRPVGFIGFSGSGKTTLVASLIAEFASRGVSVSALKHTHHILAGNENGGDTLRFLQAGATDAILAMEGEALRWTASGAPTRHLWRHATDLLVLATAELILVEGFKSEFSWPHIAVVGNENDLDALRSSNLRAVVTTAALATPLPLFDPADLPAIAAFVDRISTR